MLIEQITIKDKKFQLLQPKIENSIDAIKNQNQAKYLPNLKNQAIKKPRANLSDLGLQDHLSGTYPQKDLRDPKWKVPRWFK